MSEITLFSGFRIPAQSGPYRVKIYPPAALDKVLKAYENRKSHPGIGDPERIEKRVATIRRKAIGRPIRQPQHKSSMSPIEFKEGIRIRGGQGRR